VVKNALKLPRLTLRKILILRDVTVGFWQLIILVVIHTNSSLMLTYVHQLANMSANKQISFGSIALLVFTTAIVQLLDYFITLPTLFDLK
jgi:L-cystine uptake protein TcyP (sodium:dicarboxylate symporter family)